MKDPLARTMAGETEAETGREATEGVTGAEVVTEASEEVEEEVIGVVMEETKEEEAASEEERRCLTLLPGRSFICFPIISS